MSDSSRVQMYFSEETVFGTTDAGPLSELRFTGESLGQDIQTAVSEEIRSDRQITDVVTVGEETSGGINFELSYGTYDNLFEGALYSGDWPSELTVTASDISAASADNSFNSAGSGFPAFVPGQWVRFSGFTDANGELNGYHLVISRTAAKIVVATPITGNETAGQSVTVKGTMIRNGTTRKSYTLEKNFSDIGQFQSFRGCTVSTMNLAVNSAAMLTGSFEFMGITGALTQSTVGTGGPVAANTNVVMNATDNVGTLYEGGAPLTATTFIQAITIALNNNLRPDDAVGTLGHVDVGSGTCEVTGTMNVIFKNNAIMDKYLAGTKTSISFHAQDEAGNGYVITVPWLKFTDGKILAGGQNQTVVAEMAFQGTRHPTYGNTIQIDRFAA